MKKLKLWFTALFMAWGMFCSIPVPVKKWDEEARPYMLLWLPVVGLLVGAVWAFAAWGFGRLGFTGFLPAAILMLLPFLLTGFIHLDGYMDCCDAILSRRDLETRQKILKDSHVGSFAVICVALLFLTEFAAFCDLSLQENFPALLLLPASVRCVVGFAVMTAKPMKTSQYAAMKPKHPFFLLFMLGILCGVAVGFGAACVVSVLVAIIACVIMIRHGIHQLGGMGGDISGAAITIGEGAGLVALSILAQFL